MPQGALVAVGVSPAIVDFVKRDLSYRYTGSAVGILWTVITPLMELVLHFCFSRTD